MLVGHLLLALGLGGRIVRRSGYCREKGRRHRGPNAAVRVVRLRLEQRRVESGIARWNGGSRRPLGRLLDLPLLLLRLLHGHRPAHERLLLAHVLRLVHEMRRPLHRHLLRLLERHAHLLLGPHLRRLLHVLHRVHTGRRRQRHGGSSAGQNVRLELLEVRVREERVVRRSRHHGTGGRSARHRLHVLPLQLPLFLFQ